MNLILKKGNIIAMGLLLSFFACKKDNFQSVKPGDTGAETVQHDPFGITGKATVNYSGEFEGVVADAQQNPVSGVKVTSAYESVLTDNQGKFKIHKLNSRENITYLTFTKDGYFKTFINAQNGSLNLNVLLNKFITTIEINTKYGGYISDGPGSVSINANSICHPNGDLYSGTVKASIMSIHPDRPNFSEMVPGRDLRAKNLAGEEVQLYSYGMVGVELTDVNGNPLNIAPGKKARVTMYITYEQQTTAPDEIPLWHFDETKGTWIEEGKAVKKSGYYYEGEVSHFSFWNFDVAGLRAGVEGKITDCNNNPLPFLDVRIGQTTAQTDITGAYRAYIPSGVNNLKINIDNPYVKNEKLSFDIPVQNDKAVYKHPDIKLSCGKILTADIIGCDDQPKVAQVSLVHNGKRLNTQISYLGKVQFPIPVNINSGLELVLASTVNSIPVATYQVTIPLNDLNNYAGTFKICKTPPANSSGAFNLVDSVYEPNDYANSLFETLTSATVTFNENTDNTTIICSYNKYGFSGEISINLKNAGKGIYNLADIDSNGYWNDSTNRMSLNSPNERYLSSGGTIEILEWGYFGGKVKIKVDAVLKKYTDLDLGRFAYLGNYHLINYQFEATRLMDIE